MNLSFDELSALSIDLHDFRCHVCTSCRMLRAEWDCAWIGDVIFCRDCLEQSCPAEFDEYRELGGGD
jgi:hypothetical protein